MSKYAITLFILIVGITTISIGTTLIHGLAAEEQQSKQVSFRAGQIQLSFIIQTG